MSSVFVRGVGAVSPAGWGVAALRRALHTQAPLPTTPVTRPGWNRPIPVRWVPAAEQRPPFLAHPRLRRASALTQHSLAAALEALGEDVSLVRSGRLRLGLVVCLMPGCVTYSRRFYEEVVRDPALASPLLFPETVFNAPASHLAAFLGSAAPSYALVGDASMFLAGLALAANWLHQGRVDGCLVVGAEELDWVVAHAVRLFERHSIQGAGAGALYLRPEAGGGAAPQLGCVTDPFSFQTAHARPAAARAMRTALRPDSPRALLCLGTQGLARPDRDELAAWADWNGDRVAPKRVLGEAFTAAAAWQCVAACLALADGEYDAANVSVVGPNAQAIGARFVRPAQ